MSRRKEIERKRKIMVELRSGKKVEVKKEVKVVDADVNKDGVVDEKDLSIVHKAFAKEKKKKKIVKKKD